VTKNQKYKTDISIDKTAFGNKSVSQRTSPLTHLLTTKKTIAKSLVLFAIFIYNDIGKKEEVKCHLLSK
jgi:hypothetical protein